jgi:hypothetical protein
MEWLTPPARVRVDPLSAIPYSVCMQATTGQVHGRMITLDQEIPSLEGQRVRLMIEPVGDDVNTELAADAQAQLWQQWTERGPHGPIADDDDEKFP